MRERIESRDYLRSFLSLHDERRAIRSVKSPEAAASARSHYLRKSLLIVLPRSLDFHSPYEKGSQPSSQLVVYVYIIDNLQPVEIN